jgi:alpha-1,2-mannosyltransferase
MTAPRTEHDNPRDRTTSWRPLLVITLVGATYVGLRQLMFHTMDPEWGDRMSADLRIYVTSVREVLDGQYLYDLEPPFTYPPFALLVFAPFAWIPVAVLAVLFQLAKFVAIGESARRYIRHRGSADRAYTGRAVLLALLAVIFVDPVGVDVFDGQINLVLLFVVIADLMRPADSRWRGVGVGLAAGVKVMPALFIVYLLVSRQFRAAAVATGTFLAAVTVGFAVQPRASWAYWTDVMWDGTRIWPRPDVLLNQTVRGVVVRALGEDNRPLWAGLALVAVATGLAVAAALHRRGLELAALCMTGLTAAVITPQGWIHHWVWLAPTLLLLAMAAHRSVAAWTGVVLLFVVVNGRFYYQVGRGDPWGYSGLGLSAMEQVMVAANVVAWLALVLFAMVWLWRQPRPIEVQVELTAFGRQAHDERAAPVRR